jgi:hypothetical protein
MVHNGDVSYADGDFGHWDIFMRKIEPLASSIPYMVRRSFFDSILQLILAIGIHGVAAVGTLPCVRSNTMPFGRPLL